MNPEINLDESQESFPIPENPYGLAYELPEEPKRKGKPRGKISQFAIPMQILIEEDTGMWGACRGYESLGTARVTASNLKKHTLGMPPGRFAVRVKSEPKDDGLYWVEMRYLGAYTSVRFDKEPKKGDS